MTLEVYAGHEFQEPANEEGRFLLELILVSCCLCSSVDTWRGMHLERWVSLVLSHTQTVGQSPKSMVDWEIPKTSPKIKNGEKTWKMQPTNLEHKKDNALMRELFRPMEFFGGSELFGGNFSVREDGCKHVEIINILCEGKKGL